MHKLFIILLQCIFLFSTPVYSQPKAVSDSHELVLVLQDGSTRLLSLSSLEKLSQLEINSTTPWSSEKHNFAGVTLFDLIKKYSNTSPKIVRLTALNNYVIEMPMKEWTEYNVLLALRADGKPISIRDKGPITIVYGRKNSIFDFFLPNINDEKIPYLVWFLRKVELIK